MVSALMAVEKVAPELVTVLAITRTKFYFFEIVKKITSLSFCDEKFMVQGKIDATRISRCPR